MFGFGRKRIDMHKPLLHLTKHDPFTPDHLTKGILAIGGSGSGKTSGPYKNFVRAMMANPWIAGLICLAKPEDRHLIIDLARKTGRTNDLVFFGPQHPHRFNVLNYLGKTCDSKSIAAALMAVGDAINRVDAGGAGEQGYWKTQEARLLECAVEPLRQTGKLTADNLLQFITGHAKSDAELSSPQWRAGFHNQVLFQAHGRRKTAIEQHDLGHVTRYWTQEIPGLNDRTLSSIKVGALNTLHTINSGTVRSLLGTESTFTPEDMRQGKFIVVDCPPCQYFTTGAAINAAIKFSCQRSILSHEWRPTDRLCGIILDEVHNFLTPSIDWVYGSECRSHGSFYVALSQSAHSLEIALGGNSGHAQSRVFTSNFATKIFTACGSSEDAQFASDLCGRVLKTMTGGSMAPSDSVFDELMGNSRRFTGNFSQHYEPAVEPAEFLGGLRRGGPANNFLVDAIAIKAGEPWACGRQYQRLTFSQK